MVHDDDNDEGSTCNLNINIPTPTSYREQLNETPTGASIEEGAFVYQDDMSEMDIPPTPQVRSRKAYSPLEYDSVQDIASVGSSFMNYTYSNDYDDSTIGLAQATSSLATRSIGANTACAEIQSPGSGRPPRLTVVDIMQSPDGMGLPRQTQRRSFVPVWISNASNSIKFVIVMATAMMIASLVLVSITATVSSTSQDDSISNNEASQENPDVSIPTFEYIPTFKPTISPSASPVQLNVLMPTVPETPRPTVSPLEATNHPAVAQTPPPTETPTASPVAQTPPPTETPTASPVAQIPPPTETPTASPVATTPTPTVESSVSPSEATNSPTVQTATPTAYPNNSPSKTPTDSPTTGPTKTLTAYPTKSPSKIPTVSPTTGPTKTPTNAPTDEPSVSLSDSPTVTDSYQPTLPPTSSPTRLSTETKFFTLANRNRADKTASHLSTFPNERNEFLVHLGNWNIKDPTQCEESAYANTANIYSNSSIPVFFLPGKYEWNRCPDENLAQQHWRDNFVDYESKHWETRGYEVKRQSSRKENFAFAYKKSLYIGLNMVGSTSKAEDEEKWNQRLRDNVEWADQNVIENEDVELVVIFGSTGATTRNRPFFDDIASSIQRWTAANPSLHVMYVKQGRSEMKFTTNFYGVSNFFLFHTQSNHWPATKIIVDTSEYKLVFDDQEWYKALQDGELI